MIIKKITYKTNSGVITGFFIPVKKGLKQVIINEGLIEIPEERIIKMEEGELSKITGEFVK